MYINVMHTHDTCYAINWCFPPFCTFSKVFYLLINYWYFLPWLLNYIRRLYSSDMRVSHVVFLVLSQSYVLGSISCFLYKDISLFYVQRNKTKLSVISLCLYVLFQLFIFISVLLCIIVWHCDWLRTRLNVHQVVKYSSQHTNSVNQVQKKCNIKTTKKNRCSVYQQK